LPASPTTETASPSKLARALGRPRRLASVISLTGMGSVLTMAISTIVSIAIARTSGPAGYAVFFTANMLVFVAAILFSCGLPMALSKQAASLEEQGRHEELRHLVASGLLLLSLISITCGVVMTLFLPSLERYLNISIGWGFAAVYTPVLLCAMLSEGIQGIYLGLFRPRSVIVIAATGPLMMLLYIILRSTVWPMPLWGAVATSYICSSVVAAFKLTREGLVGFPSRHRIKPLLRDVAPSASFTFFTVFSAWSDRWIAAVYMTPEVSGAYFSAVVIISAVLRIPTNIAYLLVPASTRIALRGDASSQNFNRTMLWTYALFSAMVVVTIMLAPAAIVQLFFGQKFSLAAPALLFMTPTLLCNAISIPIISAMTGSHRNRLVTYLLGLTFLPRLYMLSYFTYRWNYVGTAFAKVVADAILALCCILLARWIGMNFPVRQLAKPFLAGFVAFCVGVGALLLDVPRVLAVALALAVFAPLMWKTVQLARASND
jgi:O-antigen/teichoic acid export membrane protein